MSCGIRAQPLSPIKSMEGKEAEGAIGGISRRISLWLSPGAKVGDYVLLHTGYAINVLDQEEAEETLRLLEELAELAEEANDSPP